MTGSWHKTCGLHIIILWPLSTVQPDTAPWECWRVFVSTASNNVWQIRLLLWWWSLNAVLRVLPLIDRFAPFLELLLLNVDWKCLKNVWRPNISVKLETCRSAVFQDFRTVLHSSIVVRTLHVVTIVTCYQDYSNLVSCYRVPHVLIQIWSIFKIIKLFRSQYYFYYYWWTRGLDRK